jgi:hypothetical protein
MTPAKISDAFLIRHLQQSAYQKSPYRYAFYRQGLNYGPLPKFLEMCQNMSPPSCFFLQPLSFLMCRCKLPLEELAIFGGITAAAIALGLCDTTLKIALFLADIKQFLLKRRHGGSSFFLNEI